MTQKNCIMLGLCFITELAYVLRLSEGYRNDFSTAAYAHGSGRALLADFNVTDEQLEAADAIIYHPPEWMGWGDHAGYRRLMERIPQHVQQITIPYPTLAMFWPFHSQDPRNGAGFGEIEDSTILYAYGDYNVTKLRREGFAPDEVVAQYAAMDIPATIDLPKLEAYLLEDQELKERNTTVKVCDYVFGSYTKFNLFNCINHGSNRLLVYIADQILGELGYPPLPRYAHEAICELMEPVIPIHPSIVRHYKLPWTTAGSRYRIDRRRQLNWEEYVLTLARSVAD